MGYGTGRDSLRGLGPLTRLAGKRVCGSPCGHWVVGGGGWARVENECLERGIIADVYVLDV